MRAVIQRVKNASVEIVGASQYVSIEHILPYTNSAIGNGLLVLFAVENSDTDEDARWLAAKIAKLRIFEDDDGKMNLSLLEKGGDILAVSQFTLFGNVKKGSRPSFNRSAHPDFSIPLSEKFCEFLSKEIGKKPKVGVFGAMMEVTLTNDGPITIILDSRNRDL